MINLTPGNNNMSHVTPSTNDTANYTSGTTNTAFISDTTTVKSRGNGTTAVASQNQSITTVTARDKGITLVTSVDKQSTDQVQNGTGTTTVSINAFNNVTGTQEVVSDMQSTPSLTNSSTGPITLKFHNSGNGTAAGAIGTTSATARMTIPTHNATENNVTEKKAPHLRRTTQATLLNNTENGLTELRSTSSSVNNIIGIQPLSLQDSTGEPSVTGNPLASNRSICFKVCLLAIVL